MGAVIFAVLLAFLSRLGLNAASEYVIGTLLTRGIGIAAGTAIGAGITSTWDVDCAGMDQLDVFVNMTGTAAPDLLVLVRPYRGSNNSVIVPGLLAPELRHSGPTLSGPGVSYEGEYDVSGYSKVRVDIQNLNVGAQTITEATWRLS